LLVQFLFDCSSLAEKVKATRVLYQGLRHTILVEGQPTADTLTWDQFVASTSGPLPPQEPVDIHKVISFRNYDFKSSHVKGIVLRDFDSIFMILSYSLDVKQLPLDILFFIFDVFILKLYHK
jgi:hypothetical protein